MNNKELRKNLNEIFGKELADGRRRKDYGESIGKDIFRAAALASGALSQMREDLSPAENLRSLIARVEAERKDYQRLYYDDYGYGNATFGAILSEMHGLLRNDSECG